MCILKISTLLKQADSEGYLQVMEGFISRNSAPHHTICVEREIARSKKTKKNSREGQVAWSVGQELEGKILQGWCYGMNCVPPKFIC